MEFGIYLNQYGDDRFESGFEDIFEQATFMEDLGYDIAAVGERHFYEDGFYDPLSCMTALAARTDSLTIASNILILPIYHPLHLAERVTALDHLTDGRTAFGVSLGYRESELVNFGVPMDDRVGRFLEILEVAKRLLEGERFDHDGEHFTFEDGFVRPEPVQNPRPPFWGGASAGAEIPIKRAAYRADGFTAPIIAPDQLAEDIDTYRAALAEAGKDPDEGSVTLMVDGYVADTTEDAIDALDPYLLDLYEQYNRWGNPEMTEHPRPSWADLEEMVLAGPPADVAETIARFDDLGVDRVIIRTQFGGMAQDRALESIRRFGTEVMPQFQ